MPRPTVLLLSSISLLLLTAISFTASATSALSQGTAVQTIAGSGALGMDDGPALTGSFLVPTGIARGRDGTVYVSDEAGQRIRALRDGRILTLAGSGALGPLGMSVLGGFKDGPAVAAQFNHPMGLAVGPDDALYIADSQNKMVRKLDHGVISTVVGGLASPQDIAFDKSGKLWIADYGAGIRRWDGHTLARVLLSNISDKPVALAISPDASNPKLIVVTAEILAEFDLAAATSFMPGGSVPFVNVEAIINIPSEGWTFGNPRQIVALGKHQAIYSDPVTNTVRYVRFAVQPLGTQPFVTRLGGGSDYRGINNAGFADGTDARFYSPRGILVYGNTIVVADAGNRRIRTLPLPQFRTQEYGLVDAAPYDSSHFEIALIGASNVFFDSHDDSDSICGAMEAKLNASHQIGKPVRCHTHRIDGATLAQEWDYIDTYLAFRHIDAYVLTCPGADDKAIAAARKVIDRTKALVMLVPYPSAAEVSDSENLVQRGTDIILFPDDRSAAHLEFLHQTESAIAGVRNLAVYDLFLDIVSYEKGPDPPIWNVLDTHMNARGNLFVGDHIAAALLRAVSPKMH